MTLPPTARAAVMIAANHDLVEREYPLPAVGAHDALVRVTCCTLCASDLHTWSGHRAGPTPAILGHEIVGEVVDLGSDRRLDATGALLRIGDRVTWTLHSSCGRCFYCTQAGLPMKCESVRKYGHESSDHPPHLQGGLAEYCLIDAGTGMVRLPSGLSDLAAAPANCACATVIGAFDAIGLASGKSVLIQGAGGLGCYAAAYAASIGCGPIVVTDIDAKRLARAIQYGATHTLDASPGSLEQTTSLIRELTGGRGVDCAVEVAGVPGVIPTGLEHLRVGGCYAVCGCVFPGALCDLDVSSLVRRRLSVVGIHNYDLSHLRRAVEFLDSTRDRFDWEGFVTHRFELSQVNEAFSTALSGSAGRVAITFA
ncbi:L-threonine 3-dehydrogenase [Planctomycetes bacterium MalM25]|nr:L-threonine 3-dehydrogenase [Planctomycetes bacterium MalM25]